MAKPNYNFEKRQRELARKKKKEEKRQRKLEKVVPAPVPGELGPVTPKEPPNAE